MDYLIKLDHMPLPVTITSPADLKHVVKLQATGLIDATLMPSLTSARTFRRMDAALVHAVTESGRAEVDAAVGSRLRSKSERLNRNSLALQYLRLFEHTDLPVLLTDERDTHGALSLLKAGLIDAVQKEQRADEPAVVRQTVQVLRVTAVGLDYLARRHGKSPAISRRAPEEVQRWRTPAAGRRAKDDLDAAVRVGGSE
ncbi:hypothetical protein [Variovorax sp. RCC_210]|uniref:hypothetical protein n=1 Tax=Variovorax sp. RCC_210 TaxID=3239217 RepID=UPI003524EC59